MGGWRMWSAAPMLADGIPVFMHRKGQRVRFLDTDGLQYGPEHRNVAPAIVWAHASGWVDPSLGTFDALVKAEISERIAEART